MQLAVDPAVVTRYSAPVPRYTSYPTAPHFSPKIGHLQYLAWLSSLPEGSRLSLYVHIPFCHSLCWYCGCNTKATRRYEPIAGYLGALETEIDTVAGLVPARHGVHHIHWGGGSPNSLKPADIARLAERLAARYTIAADAEFAVEIDPRHCDRTQADAFAAAGLTRVSIGVQDFDPQVQAAIHRTQSFETTRQVVDLFRERGVRSLNVDIVYGLPHQTLATLERTLDQVLALAPDRLATFGYAHLPERLPQQRMIDGTALPGTLERYALAERIAERLVEAGYVRIGLDHFARPSDTLAAQPVRRNFQGYTTDDQDALIGFGASAIGKLPEGYVQNATPLADYQRRIAAHGLATAKGLALSKADRLRAAIIERLMCTLEFDRSQVDAADEADGKAVLAAAESVADLDRDGLVEATPDGFRVTPKGRPFVRAICARFDAYLGTGAARHSSGV